ncbi:zinc metallopeptidase [Alkaliphilus serpentinus]|uniref:Zinc metallopeptidase n=1 Tax=Alkaliphilus serpentinus TaxID=1482731 RepID=A0A833HRA2_9FIRM|nr:zinc metallopeptidase [Alkaliphilus serpentinus]KAB3533138.1 zinc metallopeptidase [Alkaliphilus serpentinus]
MFFPVDETMIVLIPAIIFTLYAQSKVKSTFNNYLRVPTRKGYTGFDVARGILDSYNLRDIPVEPSQGHMTDHYDPRKRVVRLSQAVYNGSSIASVSVAAHEVGHALQHAGGYAPLTLRNAIFPIASFGSSAAWFFIIGGLFLGYDGLFQIGILLFGAAVAFQVVTLPVEFNASSRAIRLLADGGFIAGEEQQSSQRVLRAAALTYVAAMAASVAQLLRLILLRNRRR